MKIDVHWHHVPKPFVDAVLKGTCPVNGRVEREDGEIKIRLAGGFTQEIFGRLTDIDEAIAHMDAVGLDVVAPSLAPPLMHLDAEPAVAIQLSRTVNDGLAEAAAAHPDRLRPLANIPMQDTEAAVAELRRAVDELGFAGAAISTHVARRNLGDAVFRPFWRTAAEMDALVFIHPNPPPLGLKEGRLNRHGMANFVGLPVEHACALSSLVFDGVYEEVGSIKTCFAHGGGGFPYMLGRWRHGFEARLEGRVDHMKPPLTYLDNVYCDTLIHDETSLRFLVDRIGADHVVLGSDYPFDMGVADPYGEMARAITDDETREQIGGVTAARLLGLDETEDQT